MNFIGTLRTNYEQTREGTMNEPGTEVKEHWVSIQEAAQVWGISTRAVQKRISSGSVVTRKEGTRRYVLLTNQSSVNNERTTNYEPSGSYEPKETTKTASTTTGKVAVLEMQLGMMQQALERAEIERDRWYQQAQSLTEQNGHFQAIIVQLQQALPSRSEVTIEGQFTQVEEEESVAEPIDTEITETVKEEEPPKRRRWWQFRKG